MSTEFIEKQRAAERSANLDPRNWGTVSYYAEESREWKEKCLKLEDQIARIRERMAVLHALRGSNDIAAINIALADIERELSGR